MSVGLPDKATTIIKQVASRMSGVGFPNQPMQSDCSAELHKTLTSSIEIWKVNEIVPTGPVFALVVNKGHSPLAAHHVVDFRVGGDIYS